MIQLKTLQPLSKENLAAAGWEWLFREGNPDYLTSEVVVVRPDEVEDLFLAGNSLYVTLIEAAEKVLRENRLDEMGIPARMHRLIRETWDDERHWHLISRFDIAGGIDNQRPKLIEFNADTPTCVPETAILQWALLKANGLDESRQFNRLYEALVENYGRLKSKNEDLSPVLLVTGIAGLDEDDANLQVHAAAAEEAGFQVIVKHIEDVTFDPNEGVFVLQNDQWIRCDFMFKLIPWEYILNDEPELFDLLEKIITKRLAVVVNPPYALLLQSKRLLKVAYEMTPGNPYLLETSYHTLSDRRYVEKPAFGREGGNVRIFHANGDPITEQPGDYDVYPFIYQEFVDLPHDDQVRLYQTGLFFVHESCALIFRRGGMIINDQSPYVGHCVE